MKHPIENRKVIKDFSLYQKIKGYKKMWKEILESMAVTDKQKKSP